MPESNSHITTSGGLLTESFIDSMRTPDTSRPHTGPGSFDMPWAETPNTNRELEDEIAAAWDLLRERWDSIRKDVGHLEELDKSATRQRWLLPLLQLLDFEPDFKRPDLTPNGDEGLHFPVSHRGWDGVEEAPAAHLLEFGQDLEERQATGRGPKAKSPHDMLQVFLNVSEEDLWAILSNGRSLRLLRDYYHTFSKGYIEFDLESIFETRNYADFRALYRLAHASRFRPVETDEDEEQLPLEQFHQTARATGVKVGEDLRPQVVDAIEYLGNGFLQGDPELIEELQGDPDKARAFYSEILRVVYRILFLLFAEQRGLVPDADAELKEVYWSDYSLTALREKAEGNVPDRSDHTDLWHGLRATFEMVSEGAEALGVFGYDGELFDLEKGEYLPDRACDNAHLLRALQKLTLIEREGVQQRISYLDLGVEELGAVYENLLDFTPRVTEEPETIEDREVSAHEFILDPRGLERKQSGSYYTPDSLVNELIKSALLPVMRDRLADEGLPVVGEDDLGEVTTGLLEHYADLSEEEREAGEEALLSMDVVDPAAGSGHFLVKANDVMGAEVARLRTGDEYPTERAVRQAKRAVLARCIYAVDLNPMAVELCKVSLWINASVQDRPLSFLDHHIKQGNSLIGATPKLLEDGIPYEAFPTKSKSRSGDDGETSKAFREKTKTERKESKEGQGVQMGAFESAVTTEPRVAYEAGDFEQVAQEKPKQARQIYAEYLNDEERRQAKLEADMYTAAFFWPMPEGTEWAPTYGELFRVQRQGRGAIPDEQRARVEEMADDYNFFHWHLEFPEVFDESGSGGFDVVLGNPPWDVLEFKEPEFFAVTEPSVARANSAEREEFVGKLPNTDPELYRKYNKEKRFSNALNTYLRESGRYPLTAVGRMNTYGIFSGLTREIRGSKGRVGIIVKSGISTDYTYRKFFGDIVENQEVISLYDFENREPLFHGVDSRTKFCLLTLTGGEAPGQKIDFAFFMTRPDHLTEEERHFTLTPEELLQINPNTGNSPVFRKSRDAELIKSIHRRVPVLVNERESSDPWGLTIRRIFNMGLSRVSRKCLSHDGDKDEERKLSRMYESKLLHQYSHRLATYANGDPGYFDKQQKMRPDASVEPRYWIPAQEVEEALTSNGWDRGWLLGWRDVCQPTDERTTIAAVLPRTATDFTIRIGFSDQSAKLPCLLANLNSFVLDYCTRQMLGGKHLSDYITKQLPVHPPDRYTPGLFKHIVPLAM